MYNNFNIFFIWLFKIQQLRIFQWIASKVLIIISLKNRKKKEWMPYVSTLLNGVVCFTKWMGMLRSGYKLTLKINSYSNNNITSFKQILLMTLCNTSVSIRGAEFCRKHFSVSHRGIQRHHVNAYKWPFYPPQIPLILSLLHWHWAFWQ